VKLALAQVNPTVGDFGGNLDIALDAATRAHEAGASLIVYPELTLTGYPPRDLLGVGGFVEECGRTLDEFARKLPEIRALVGYVYTDESLPPGMAYNACAAVAGGEVVTDYRKRLLPQYDVFDEVRYFEPGRRGEILEIDDLHMGLTVCEDIWYGREEIRGYYDHDPVADYIGRVDLLVNLSASPFVAGKPEVRLELLRQTARRSNAAVVYVNQVGGNDELIFDGRSAVLNAGGEVVAMAKAFEEDLLIVDTDSLTGTVPSEGGRRLSAEASGLSPGSTPQSMPPDTPPGPRIDDIARALVLGTRDYIHKCGFETAVVGLSGGADSSVVAGLAVEALGASNVTGILMPSRYSSEHSVVDAEALSRNLGIRHITVPIEPMFAAYLDTLGEMFEGTEPDIAEENLQARIRGAIVMAYANKFGSLVLATSNKSEASVGYATLYGDMCGAIGVIVDVVKTDVYKIGRWLNRHGEVIPENVFTKPPSAELKPGQVDQDALPPYDLLDRIVELHIEQDKTAAEIVAEGLPETEVREVLRKIRAAEYKRRQAAPGLKVTGKAFGMGRRFPIAQGYGAG
jgi:NAD+ synthase (glutamine-hydrolysing)